MFSKRSQDDRDDIGTNSCSDASSTSPDLAELDMLIVHTEDGDDGDLRLYKVYDDDDGDNVVDYDEESGGGKKILRSPMIYLEMRLMMKMGKMTLNMMMSMSLSPTKTMDM